MILSRFTRNLREQNWAAVCLDFLVVVVGIFAGLQAADWNQTRLDRKEAAYHLEFLYTQLSADAREAAAEIEEKELVLQRSFETVQLLGMDVWSEDNRSQFDESIFATFELWGPRYRPVSLRRMIDDGKIDLLASKPLQSAVLDFESAYLEAIEQTKTAYAYSLVLTPKITLSMRFKGIQIVSTTSDLLNDRVLEGAVRDKAVWQRIQYETLLELQAARKTLLAILKEHVALPGDA